MGKISIEDLDPIIKAYVDETVRVAVEEFARKNLERIKELSLIERIVRVEEELKALKQVELSRFEALQREIDAKAEASEKRIEALQREMNARFEASEKRFEALQTEIDSRFMSMEKRLGFIQWFMGVGFTVVTVLVALMGFLKG